MLRSVWRDLYCGRSTWLVRRTARRSVDGEGQHRRSGRSRRAYGSVVRDESCAREGGRRDHRARLQSLCNADPTHQAPLLTRSEIRDPRSPARARARETSAPRPRRQLSPPNTPSLTTERADARIESATLNRAFPTGRIRMSGLHFNLRRHAARSTRKPEGDG